MTKLIQRTVILALGLTVGLFANQLQASEVNIANLMAYVDVKHGNQMVRIKRIQDTEHRLTGGFTKTSRPCPPFCFQPMIAARGVGTVGEVEVIRFLTKEHRRGSGILVDARTPKWFETATIPGSINAPFTIFEVDEEVLEVEGEDADVVKALKKFGVTFRDQTKDNVGFIAKLFSSSSEEKASKLDFSKAKTLLLFCNGPWCGQSPRAIRALLKLGYPSHKLFYYRGGMQNWQMGGFTTVSAK